MPKTSVISRKPLVLKTRKGWSGGQSGNSGQTRTIQDRLLNMIKPCFTNCPMYETCTKIQNRPPNPGDVCLDQAYSVRLFLTIFESLLKGSPTDNMKQYLAFVLASQMNILAEMAANIDELGVMVEEEVTDVISGTVTKRMALNPAVIPFTKIAEKLSITPESMLLTPKSIADNKHEEDLQKTLGEIIGLATQFADDAVDMISQNALPGGGNGKKALDVGRRETPVDSKNGTGVVVEPESEDSDS